MNNNLKNDLDYDLADQIIMGEETVDLPQCVFCKSSETIDEIPLCSSCYQNIYLNYENPTMTDDGYTVFKYKLLRKEDTIGFSKKEGVVVETGVQTGLVHRVILDIKNISLDVLKDGVKELNLPTVIEYLEEQTAQK